MPTVSLVTRTGVYLIETSGGSQPVSSASAASADTMVPDTLMLSYSTISGRVLG